MFGRKKDCATITEKDPVFEARYLGNVETFSANGKGCAIIPVRNLWENSQSEKHLKKVLVVMNSSGVTVKEHKKDEGKKFSIENITFCNADKTANERIFCWIWKVPGIARLECHAVLCSSRESAQAMALVLSRAFQVAYRDWRANKGRQIRQRKNSLLHEKHIEDGLGVYDPLRRRGSGEANGRPISSEHRENGERRASVGGYENCSGEKRRSSTTSTTSGFASSVILDPDEEETIQANMHVQAIVRGDSRGAGDSDLGSD